jgi:hypothetical protein
MSFAETFNLNLADSRANAFLDDQARMLREVEAAKSIVEKTAAILGVDVTFDSLHFSLEKQASLISTLEEKHLQPLCELCFYLEKLSTHPYNKHHQLSEIKIEKLLALAKGKSIELSNALPSSEVIKA